MSMATVTNIRYGWSSCSLGWKLWHRYKRYLINSQFWYFSSQKDIGLWELRRKPDYERNMRRRAKRRRRRWELNWHLAWQHIIQMTIVNCHCQQIQLSAPKLSASSQLELLYHEILYLRECLVDVLAYFLLVINKRDGAPFISLPLFWCLFIIISQSLKLI